MRLRNGVPAFVGSAGRHRRNSFRLAVIVGGVLRMMRSGYGKVLCAPPREESACSWPSPCCGDRHRKAQQSHRRPNKVDCACDHSSGINPPVLVKFSFLRYMDAAKCLRE